MGGEECGGSNRSIRTVFAMFPHPFPRVVPSQHRQALASIWMLCFLGRNDCKFAEPLGFLPTREEGGFRLGGIYHFCQAELALGKVT